MGLSTQLLGACALEVRMRLEAIAGCLGVRSSSWEWVTALAVVDFDVDVGHVLRDVCPSPEVLSEADTANGQWPVSIHTSRTSWWHPATATAAGGDSLSAALWSSTTIE